ncbi:hypothetical protein [Kamptonema formosum]|uniref:hypothetical protein n=1 Tax=Kamptonema formosum TaxID=331992 RepID=UPI0003497D0B|nr:hypothetical protein [Oscillatoria sp. PCC 10802]
MSAERWNDEMLDRLANFVDSNARVIQALANAAAEAREERQQLLQLIAQHQERMDQQQAEIVGLRTETNRMLDILLNRREGGDNPTP